MDQKPSHISNRTPLLDQIEVPADLRRLPESDLRQVADELRAELIDAVSITGGSGQIPAFRSDLAAMFGETRLEQRDAFTAVVHGLGVRAQQSFSSAASARG